MRPANMITAVADILAGMSIVHFVFDTNYFHVQSVLYLSISTLGLYGGGVVFNDVFDAELDAIERPERAIPSKKVTLTEASMLGSILLLIGVISAYLQSPLSAIFAIITAIAALVYDKWGKHHSFLGPVNMGLCRGFNLLLGMSVMPEQWQNFQYLAIIPVIYIAAITMVSRGEVHGGSKNILYFAALLYLLVSSAQLYVSFTRGTLWLTAILVASHLYLIGKPLFKAIQLPIGPNIGKAVKAGVLSLIIMDAAWVSLSGNIVQTLIVVLLLPLSMRLAKMFAVT
ncbi:UbiA-like protein EboC [Flectobacillus roseus]|uniref:UbiA-like protein EboC n=1 Tax=Flectobacillus roseus TaxID=502259 RepID=A0ABT6YA19_9BACT|nr:UbiA-like protein EboC [Flectobacillus roseus]MDI9859963.1 UbiA-like protein EboC [Flectobacillus roseus]